VCACAAVRRRPTGTCRTRQQEPSSCTPAWHRIASHGMAWHGMAGPASPSLRTVMGSICRCGAEQTMPAVLCCAALRCAALRTN
jgi:hypothetical protein